MVRPDPLTVRRLTGVLAALFLLLGLASVVASPLAHAFSIQPNPSTRLDGKVLVSPSAMRIRTTTPDSSEPIGPGKEFHYPLLIQNRTKGKLTFDLDVQQVVGGSDVVEVRPVHEGAAAWVTLERRTVTLKPGDTATIGVNGIVPKLVKPGSKAFAVAVTQRGGAVQSSGAGVTPVFRQLAIYIVELPGDAPIKGKITRASVLTDETIRRQFEGKKQQRKGWFIGDQNLSFVLSYHNSGERLLTPKGSLQLKDMFGRVVGHYKIEHLTVYPDGTSDVQFELKDLPWFSVFHGKVTLDSDAGHQVKDLGWMVVAPAWLKWLIIALLLLIAGMVGLGFWRRRQWRKWEAEHGEDGEDGDDDESADDDYDPDEDDDDEA